MAAKTTAWFAETTFWTFGCYNCRNTIPYLKEWNSKYASEKFVIIGIHTPESDREKDVNLLKRQLRVQGISYPVVTDNTRQTWDAYAQEYVHIGEGSYRETEMMIRSLLDKQ
jgi:thiol-disulfide isomerase/thioredoxin